MQLALGQLCSRQHKCFGAIRGGQQVIDVPSFPLLLTQMPADPSIQPTARRTGVHVPAGRESADAERSHPGCTCPPQSYPQLVDAQHNCHSAPHGSGSPSPSACHCSHEPQKQSRNGPASSGVYLHQCGHLAHLRGESACVTSLFSGKVRGWFSAGFRRQRGLPPKANNG